MADNMSKSITPIGGALRDYVQTVRAGYKASRDAKKSRTDALKDARASGKTVWKADSAVMKETGYIRKKAAATGRQGGSAPVSLPPAANQPTAQPASGGFRIY